MSEMTCRQLIEVLSEFHADSLPSERRVVLEQHLDECEECQEYLRTYRETIQLTQAALSESEAEALCSEMPEELVQAILRSIQPDE